MRKIAVGMLALASATAYASVSDGMSVSGFGSFGIGQADNDIGYAGHTSEAYDTKYDTLGGLQFDFDVNERAKFSTQLVANGRYDFDPAIETAYLSYEMDDFTVRAGKIRTPLFMYSEYLDVGYAYPMLRPSPAIYETFIFNSFTGVDLLIPYELGDAELQFQPFVGTSQIEKRDSNYGGVDFDNLVGLTTYLYIDDFTLRASLLTTDMTYNMPANVKDMPDLQKALLYYADASVDGKRGTFGSLGIQYDNGDLLTVLELIKTKAEGRYQDVQAASFLTGYRIDNVTPYFSIEHIETTDNQNRSQPLPGELSIISGPEQILFNYKRTAYTLGYRWDFAKNIAIKADVSYVDYHDTSGGTVSNVNQGNFADNYLASELSLKEDSSMVYSASIDFVF